MYFTSLYRALYISLFLPRSLPHGHRACQALPRRRDAGMGVLPRSGRHEGVGIDCSGNIIILFP